MASWLGPGAGSEVMHTILPLGDAHGSRADPAAWELAAGGGAALAPLPSFLVDLVDLKRQADLCDALVQDHAAGMDVCLLGEKVAASLTDCP